MIDIAEHDDSANDGVPGGLPGTERILWQGKPDWRRLATRALHLRKVAIYFLALYAIRQLLLWRDGAPAEQAIASAVQTIVLGGVAIGLLALLAWLLARATVYTLTSRRLIMSFGVALPVSLNMPFSRLAAADLREFHDGSGDIVLTTVAGERLSYAVLWPHVKPFSIGRAQPMLRAVPAVADVAEILSAAIAAESQAAARRPQPEAAEPAPAVPARRGLKRLLEYPTGPLAAACALVIFALVSVGFLRVVDAGAERATPAPAVAEISLRFEDRDDGSVLVIDAGSEVLLDTLAPGTNGFVRSTLRGLARARRAQDAGSDTPFRLLKLDTGRVLLLDPVTGREVDLYAFGRSNAKTLARFLEPADASSATINRPPESEPAAHTTNAGGDVVLAGRTRQEARQ